MKVENIALCLSTEPRFWEVTAFNVNYIQKWADDNNINLHIFFHTWDHISIRWPREDYIDIFKANNYNESNFLLKKRLEEQKIVDSIQPTAHIIENKDCLNYFIEKLYNKPTINRWVKDKKHLEYKIKYTNEPCISQIYSMLKSFKIMADYGEANDIHYDLVIRSRFDQSLFNLFYDKPTENAFNRMFSKHKPQFKHGLSHGVRRDPKLQKNILCPRFAINWRRKLWMEFCVFIGTSYCINTTTLQHYEDRLLDLAVVQKENGAFLETSSHWVVAEYIIQHFIAGLTNPKPQARWQYKLNHVPRALSTEQEYDSLSEKLLDVERQRTNYRTGTF